MKPDFGKAWANLGVALASTGDIDGAEQPFLNAVKFDPNAKNWLNLGAYPFLVYRLTTIFHKSSH